MREFQNREQIEEQIEILIALLDVIDGDPDLEPSLGLNGHLSNDPPDLEGDDCDIEPSLGAPEGVFSQLCWGAGPMYDLEDECEDEGELSDDEPSDNGIADADGLHDYAARAASIGSAAI